MIDTVKIFIQEKPGLAALLIFIILAIDTFYVYRMFKRTWKKSSRNRTEAHAPKRNSPGSD